VLGFGSAGKFYFLSLLVNQLALWIRCAFHGNNKVHRANEALKQLVFAFLSYLEQGACTLSVFYNCGRSFAGNHCLRIRDFFFLRQKESIRCFWQALLACSVLQYVADTLRSVHSLPHNSQRAQETQEQ